jgi:hypothetical protein
MGLAIGLLSLLSIQPPAQADGLITGTAQVKKVDGVIWVPRSRLRLPKSLSRHFELQPVKGAPAPDMHPIAFRIGDIGQGSYKLGGISGGVLSAVAGGPLGYLAYKAAGSLAGNYREAVFSVPNVVRKDDQRPSKKRYQVPLVTYLDGEFGKTAEQALFNGLFNKVLLPRIESKALTYFDAIDSRRGAREGDGLVADFELGRAIRRDSTVLPLTSQPYLGPPRQDGRYPVAASSLKLKTMREASATLDISSRPMQQEMQLPQPRAHTEQAVGWEGELDLRTPDWHFIDQL